MVGKSLTLLSNVKINKSINLYPKIYIFNMDNYKCHRHHFIVRIEKRKKIFFLKFTFI